MPPCLSYLHKYTYNEIKCNRQETSMANDIKKGNRIHVYFDGNKYSLLKNKTSVWLRFYIQQLICRNVKERETCLMALQWYKH